MPPITITQAVDFFSYGLKRDYVTWNNISDNVKLAVLASEDQGFLNHYGIDWTSLEKSMLPNTKRKSKKMSWGGGASTISQQTAKKRVFMAGERCFKIYQKNGRIYLYTFNGIILEQKKNFRSLFKRYRNGKGRFWN